MLEIRESRADTGTLTLTLLGRLDIASSPALRARLDELAESADQVRIEMSRLDLVDARGMAVLVAAVEDARDSGWALQIETLMSPQVAAMVERWGAARHFWPDDESEASSASGSG